MPMGQWGEDEKREYNAKREGGLHSGGSGGLGWGEGSRPLGLFGCPQPPPSCRGCILRHRAPPPPLQRGLGVWAIPSVCVGDRASADSPAGPASQLEPSRGGCCCSACLMVPPFGHAIPIPQCSGAEGGPERIIISLMYNKHTQSRVPIK